MDFADEALPIGELLDERRHLLGIALRMLGSGAEADRVVDTTYRRWYELPQSERAGIDEPRAWLSRVAGRICLERLARPGRLRSGNDVFEMAPGSVTDIVGKSESACTELADRARRSLRDWRRQPTTPQQQDAVVGAVREACATANTGRLTALLTQDATAFFDGGGKVRALVRPMHGREQVARSLLTLLAPGARTTVDTHSINGRTGLVVRYNQQVAAVVSLDIFDRQVVQVCAVINPDKLRHWNHVSACPGPP